MVEAALTKKRYTYEDYLKTPEGWGYELLEGELLVTPSPNTRHQRVSQELTYTMVKFVNENGLGEVFHACDVYFDEEDVVQPDILFVSKERLGIIGEKNIQGAPDLIVEILSEGTAYRDAIQKKVLYARYGVKEYWIVAPKEKMVEVYQPESGVYRLIKTCLHADILESVVLKGFKVALKEIF